MELTVCLHIVFGIFHEDEAFLRQTSILSSSLRAKFRISWFGVLTGPGWPTTRSLVSRAHLIRAIENGSII